MATYLIVTLGFILVVCLVARVRPSLFHRKALFATAIALFLLTAIFDNLIVGFSIVAYDHTKLLGLHLGSMPIEDFTYALLAVLLVPTVWKRIGAKRAH